MIEKNGITLDAFVLDDGWDVYKSDWVLRPGEFPHGLRPIADALALLIEKQNATVSADPSRQSVPVRRSIPATTVQKADSPAPKSNTPKLDELIRKSVYLNKSGNRL